MFKIERLMIGTYGFINYWLKLLFVTHNNGTEANLNATICLKDKLVFISSVSSSYSSFMAKLNF